LIKVTTSEAVNYHSEFKFLGKWRCLPLPGNGASSGTDDLLSKCSSTNGEIEITFDNNNRRLATDPGSPTTTESLRVRGKEPGMPSYEGESRRWYKEITVRQDHAGTNAEYTSEDKKNNSVVAWIRGRHGICSDG
jgi:hypothetical protein